MNALLLALRVSRPRFWLYLAGTYLVGYAAGMSAVHELLQLQFVVHFLFFLIPANVILYGINDYFDRDTDQFNAKKLSKEHFLQQQQRKHILLALICCVFVAIGLSLFETVIERVLLCIFLALAWLYSAPPVRFKARPFFDSLSNALYIVPGVLGYYQSSAQLPSALLLVGLICWTAAMHLFSAVPDIVPDRKAAVHTTATVLDREYSLVVCALLWFVFSALIIYATSYAPWSFASLIYVCIPLLLLPGTPAQTERVYWYFPYINALLGAVAFLALTLPKV